MKVRFDRVSGTNGARKSRIGTAGREAGAGWETDIEGNHQVPPMLPKWHSGASKLQLVYERMSTSKERATKDQMKAERTDESPDLADETARENVRLVLAIVEGDREAEREFADRYLPKVRVMLLARSRDRELAADLVQEVMIEAICALRRGQLREPAKLSHFVLAIARNVLNSHYRGAVRQPESLEFPDDLPDLKKDSDEMEDRQRESLALGAISSLDPVDKSILQMTLLEGLKPGLIAQRLGLSSDVVRQRKVRATRRVVEFIKFRSQNEFRIHSMAGQKP